MCIVLQTMAHELEQESLLRDNQTDRQVKALEVAAAEQQRKLQEDLKFKDQQIAELQVWTGALFLHALVILTYLYPLGGVCLECSLAAVWRFVGAMAVQPLMKKSP